MFCDGSKHLMRNKNMKSDINDSKLGLPLLSRTQVKENMMSFLSLFCKNNDIFYSMFRSKNNVVNILGIRPIAFVAPGMAIKLYSSVTPVKNMSINQKSVFNETISVINNTNDMDFSINLSRNPVTTNELESVVTHVFTGFDNACVQFVNALGQSYNNLLIQLVQKGGNINPRYQGQPFSNKIVYAVKQYFVSIDGVNYDLMDVAIQFDPAITEKSISQSVSKVLGVPMLKKRSLFEQLLIMIKIDILGTSQINIKRHPITGLEKAKGIKDLYRLKYLCFFGTSNTSQYCSVISHMINVLKTTKYNNKSKAQRLRNIIKNIM